MQADQLSSSQIERWRLLYEEYKADVQQVEDFKKLDERRTLVRQEMVDFLQKYLIGEISTKQFKETFDLKTRSQWNTFGLKGLSGGMFLNILVNHVSDEPALTNQLCLVLPAPKDVADGRERMRVFLNFLERLISSHQATKKQIQPARAPFFISGWWHLQATEQWPIFYPRTRYMLEIEGLYTSVQSPIEDYFAFRESFLSIATALRLTVWELEHLSAWYNEKRNVNIADTDEEISKFPSKSVSASATEVNIYKSNEGKSQTSTEIVFPGHLQPAKDDEQAISGHAHIQWLLAKIGQRLGCQIWIAGNDQGKLWAGEKLGNLSLKTFPNLGMDSEFQRIISLIDVLWIIKGTSRVAAAFEVEHTTSIYSGLLRMSDLVALSPNINFPLYIVTPDIRLEQVRRELARPTFQVLELHKRCAFFSEESLIQHAENIMRWANHPSAIERLAFKVGDLDS